MVELGAGIVVVFEAVLKGESVNINDGRLPSGKLQGVGVIQNLVLLHGHQQNIDGRTVQAVTENLIVDVYVAHVEWYVLRGLVANGFAQLRLCPWSASRSSLRSRNGR